MLERIEWNGTACIEPGEMFEVRFSNGTLARKLVPLRFFFYFSFFSSIFLFFFILFFFLFFVAYLFSFLLFFAFRFPRLQHTATNHARNKYAIVSSERFFEQIKEKQGVNEAVLPVPNRVLCFSIFHVRIPSSLVIRRCTRRIYDIPLFRCTLYSRGPTNAPDFA